VCLVWSPEFWNLCGEKVMREIENEPDITVGVHTINLLRYADDIVLVADSPQKLQSLLDKVVADSAKVGLSLNYKKTTMCMAVTKQATVPLQNYIFVEAIKMDKFNYIGSLLTSDDKCDT